VSSVVVDHHAKAGFFHRPVALLSALLLIQLIVFFPTYQSMVDIWWRSETFAHGFFILPISAYLIWKKRQLLSTIESKPDFRMLLLLAGTCVLWLVANAVDVLVVEQFAVVLMLPLLVCLVMGFKLTAVIAFPLAFLLLAVPFGDFLVYPLMEFTAVFTVNAVRAVGIPVFWEGLYFTLPSGSWSVVEACSGFRYILASITLGALYAYLTYQSFWRRSAFMLLALVVPIVANGLRAFMIVMIGHFSGMELAVGVDHLIYGWVWFGIVMFAMFWLGSFWQEKSPVQEVIEPLAAESITQTVNFKQASIAVICATALLLTPILLKQQMNPVEGHVKTIQLPQVAGDWQQQNKDNLSTWEPHYKGASQELTATYIHVLEQVGVHVAYFGSQQQGAELVNSSHRLVSGEQKDLGWKVVSRTARNITAGTVDIALKEVQIKSTNQSILLWQWKYFNGTNTDNDFYLKALEAWAELTGQSRHAAAIILYVELNGLTEDSAIEAASKLQSMVEGLLPELEREFD